MGEHCCWSKFKWKHLLNRIPRHSIFTRLAPEVDLVLWLTGSVSVPQSCLALWDPLDSSPPGSSVHGILQARTLEWVAIPFSRRSSPPKDQTHVSCIAGRFFTVWATRGFKMLHSLRLFHIPTVKSLSVAHTFLNIYTKKYSLERWEKTMIF